MLETAVAITHERCVLEQEARYNDRVFAGHGSVTELDICRELREYHDHADLCDQQAERDLDAAFRSTYETDIQYREESFLTAGGFTALS